MISQNIALYDWTNGVIMIGVFAVVCIALVVALIIFMASGKKKEDTEEQKYSSNKKKRAIQPSFLFQLIDLFQNLYCKNAVKFLPGSVIGTGPKPT